VKVLKETAWRGRRNLLLEKCSAKYAIPTPANYNVERDCVESLTPSVNRPSYKPIMTTTLVSLTSQDFKFPISAINTP
jgi:hypothetical protein